MERASHTPAKQSGRSGSLLRRIRWLFALFGGVGALAALVSLLDTSGVTPGGRTLGAVAIAAWLGWVAYRYRRPEAPVATDLVPIAAMLALGFVSGRTGVVFAPALGSLFFRAMFGSRWEAVANGLAYFAAYEAVAVAGEGVQHLGSPGALLLLVSFPAIALVMHELGATAAAHERLIERERLLTEVSRGLLQARTVDRVRRVAVGGTHRLAGGDAISVSLWEGQAELVVTASKGIPLELTSVSLGGVPASQRERFAAADPYLLSGDRARQRQTDLGHPPVFEQLLVAPLTHDHEAWGALVLAAQQGLDADLVEIMGRFANEVSLALGRTRLLAELEEANAELRRLDLAKDEFVSTVSHELRTPLTSIRGFAQTLRLHWEQLAPEQIERYLAVIVRQSETQQQLVEDLLTTSRIVADRLPIAPDDVAVHAVLRDALDVIQLPEEHIKVDCPPDLVAVVDRQHLEQTLTNLLSNAGKYGAPPYEIQAAASDGVVVIRVADHGEGIEPAFRDHMFDPFEQADRGDTRTARGVGLGLAIVRSLIEANDGTVRYVDDAATPGACFEVRLPRAG